jgi:hypothetical protein
MFAYAGRTVQAGEAFDAVSERDAYVLTTIGHAVEAPYVSSGAAFTVDGTDEALPISTPKKRKRRRAVDAE